MTYIQRLPMQKKHSVMQKFVTDYTSLWTILKPIEGQQILCLKLKYSSLPRLWEGGLGCRTRRYCSLSCVSAFCNNFTTFMGNMQHYEKCPQIPEKCLSYSWRETFRVGISVKEWFAHMRWVSVLQTSRISVVPANSHLCGVEPPQ